MELESHQKLFQESIENLKKELSSLLVHRASPSMVEPIHIDYYGSSTPLHHVAAISTPDSHTIVIKPWDTKLLEPIEKAILKSQLHIQPIVKQDVVMIVLPPLSGERREMLLKLLGKKIEETRIRIRMIRDDIMKEIQGAEKNKEISEDEKFRLKTKLDEMVKTHNSIIEEISDKKREEISS